MNAVSSSNFGTLGKYAKLSKTILIVRYLHIDHLFVIQNIQSAIILFTFFILNIVEVQ